jgi:diacylglycerol kinase family enzyme
MRQVVFVVNSAGAHHVDRLKQWCHEGAAQHGWGPCFIDTAKGAGDTELNEYLASHEEALVFAAGGDGTVRTCAQAIVRNGKATPLAVLPWGTANLFAHAVGVPTGPEAALATGFGDNERRTDVALWGEQVYVAMAGMGLDAAVVGATPDLLKEHLGWFSYAVAGLSLLHRPPHDYTVRLDGGEPLARSARSVVVGNIGALPGGFPLLPEAKVDDGLLDVCVLAPRGPLEWALLAEHVLAGRRHNEPYLERHQVKQVEVAAGAVVPREMDGEVVDSGSSLNVSVLPAALVVRVP